MQFGKIQNVGVSELSELKISASCQDQNVKPKTLFCLKIAIFRHVKKCVLSFTFLF